MFYLFLSRFLLLLRRFVPTKPVLKLRHAHFFAAEFHAFHFQPKTLIQAAFAGNRDPAACGHHAMPGQPVRLAQGAYNEAPTTEKTSCLGDSTISRDMAARDL